MGSQVIAKCDLCSLAVAESIEEDATREARRVRRVEERQLVHLAEEPLGGCPLAHARIGDGRPRPPGRRVHEEEGMERAGLVERRDERAVLQRGDLAETPLEERAAHHRRGEQPVRRPDPLAASRQREEVAGHQRELLGLVAGELPLRDGALEDALLVSTQREQRLVALLGTNFPHSGEQVESNRGERVTVLLQVGMTVTAQQLAGRAHVVARRDVSGTIFQRSRACFFRAAKSSESCRIGDGKWYLVGWHGTWRTECDTERSDHERNDAGLPAVDVTSPGGDWLDPRGMHERILVPPGDDRCRDRSVSQPEGDPLQEQRRYPRKPVDLAVTLVGPDGEETAGRGEDLSLGGMFLTVPRTYPFGTKVVVKTKLPTLGDTELPGVVRWVKPDGMGIQFGLLGARQTHAITGMTKE
jgi:hypothetical protein